MNQAAGPSNLVDVLAGRIERHGPVPFDEVMDLALYDPARGFYATGGAAGRRADFMTSVEVGPLFGALVARALDRSWDELGCPDPFVVVEAGAGVGTLARTVSVASPRCAGALTYVLVERSAQLRSHHGTYLALSEPSQAFPPVRDPDADVASSADRGTGPRFVSSGDLPRIRGRGVVLANELLDNLACELLAFTDHGWAEVRVGVDGDPPTLREHLVGASDARRTLAESLVDDPEPGMRIPCQLAASSWLHQALSLLDEGRVIVIDYASTTTAELAARPMDEWLRTYRSHAPGSAVLDDVGAQDITCEVAIDQLARVRSPTTDQSQAAFLAELGIDELVEEGRRIWNERAHLGDLEAVRGRSRVGEAEALLDPSGLGAFRVLQWQL